jgi:hypothetical protein
MLKLVVTNENPLPAEINRRDMIRNEIAESRAGDFGVIISRSRRGIWDTK